ncbi:MAG: hypothetical protein Pg6C_13900 [Treponemataceae bacterium]|nr:MAG: hypothetical protein Pg6C_13900 [Treponemataceae bacterium]
MRELAKGERRELSKKAKFRFEVIGYYLRSSAWFGARRLQPPENRALVPKKNRAPEYSRELAKRGRISPKTSRSLRRAVDTRRVCC